MKLLISVIPTFAVHFKTANMKTVMIAAAITLFTVTTNAQQVEVRANAGNVSSVSVGLSTWNWLYVGVDAFGGGSNFPMRARTNNRFYGGNLFLQPTIKISEFVSVYAAAHYGYFVYYKFPVKDKNKSTNYRLSAGCNYFFNKAKTIGVNAEIGYLQYQVYMPLPRFTPSYLAKDNPATGSWWYGSVGVVVRSRK